MTESKKISKCCGAEIRILPLTKTRLCSKCELPCIESPSVETTPETDVSGWRDKLADLAEKYCPDDKSHGENCLYHDVAPMIEKEIERARVQGQDEWIESNPRLVNRIKSEALSSYKKELKGKVEDFDLDKSAKELQNDFLALLEDKQQG